MRRQRCPYCQGMVDVLNSDLGRMVQCDKVRCAGWFLVTPEQSVELDPAPSEPAILDAPGKPRLTGPHRCLVCSGETSHVFNRRRCTVVHRSQLPDRPDNCRMDVYAAIYFCPHCIGETLLETPFYQWGRDVTCPVCTNTFQSPRDDVLHEHAGDAREGVTMAFRCPSCASELRCDTIRRGQPITGTRVVCFRCQHILIIPGHGEAVARFTNSNRGRA